MVTLKGKRVRSTPEGSIYGLSVVSLQKEASQGESRIVFLVVNGVLFPLGNAYNLHRVKEAYHSAEALVDALREGLAESIYPAHPSEYEALGLADKSGARAKSLSEKRQEEAEREKAKEAYRMLDIFTRLRDGDPVSGKEYIDAAETLKFHLGKSVRFFLQHNITSRWKEGNLYKAKLWDTTDVPNSVWRAMADIEVRAKDSGVFLEK